MGTGVATDPASATDAMVTATGTAGSSGSSSDAESTESDPTTAASTTDDETTTTSSTTYEPEPIECDPGVTQCGVQCVDLQTDPNNCGDCGISCVVANATAACVDGICALGACDVGFADCDSAIANGCEAVADCSPAACMTECGSEGVTDCPDGCNPVCVIPEETCNAVDDDCNGECDEGPLPNCRVSVHRAIGPNGHFYTNDLNATMSGGHTLEAQDYYFLYAEQGPTMQPLHHCVRPSGAHLYTADNGCEGAGALQETLGFFAPKEICGGIPLYRLHNPGPDRHFYTTSAAERDNAVNNLGYVSEGTVGFVWTGA